MSGAAKHIFEADELHSELGGELQVRIGVVRDQLHVEGLDQPEKLGPDVTEADRP